MTKDCRFCRSNGLLADAALAETARHFLLVGRDPELPGAVMVVPHAHFADPFAMSADDWADLPAALTLAREHLAPLRPAGFTLGWNVGAAAGQTVGHAHLHVIARHDGGTDAGLGIRAFLKAARKAG